MALVDDLLSIQGEPIESPWLEEVHVVGFQGVRNFTIQFSPNANFLIGKNGSGKTTLINLINAGLCGDTSALFRLRFRELRLSLTFGKEASRYSLVYKRIAHEDRPLQEMSFNITGPRGGTLYKQNLFDRDRVSLRYLNERTYSPYYEGPGIFEIGYAFDKAKRSRPVTTWLSILRSDPSRSPSPEIALQNPIDRKLEELTKRTSSYLSALDSRASSRSAKFQKDYFLSLIGYKGGDAFGKAVSTFNSLDLDIEESNLGKILSHLKLAPLDYRHKLKTHFDDARKLTKDKPAYTLQDALQIADTLRIHELNEKWLTFEQDRAEIYLPKFTFMEIVTNLFETKNLVFTERNQPLFILDKDRRLNLSDLSSGEKQVYIILSEALVQEGKRAIYLADEPELSLHVEWQQYLVENIFKINRNCQVIFATHSPDILGPYNSNAINVEKL